MRGTSDKLLEPTYIGTYYVVMHTCFIFSSFFLVLLRKIDAQVDPANGSFGSGTNRVLVWFG